MISWIVTSHDDQILRRNLLSTLTIHENDELICIYNKESITSAYAEGQEQATKPIRVYIHHDVRILDIVMLRYSLAIDTAQPDIGIVGLIGSKTMVLPWWNGDLCGSVVDSRIGTLDFGFGGPVAVVDGLLLATSQTIDWDISWPGWHGYEYDACAQMLDRGLTNWCMSNGKRLVSHNSDSPFDLHSIDGWPGTEERFHAKWGPRGANL